jgi:hypothetical protein
MRLMGDPFGNGGQPNPVPGGSAAAIGTEVGKALFELGVALVRDSARDLYSGNPSNNTGTAEDGGRTYYRGLDLLINTGYQDVVTGQACEAADSIIYDYNASIDANATGFVEAMTYVYRNLKWISRQTGLDPVTWTISMTWGAFYEITAVWPCAYDTYRCSLDGTNNRAVSSREELNRMTDNMRNGSYLLIDGEQVDVTIDDAITETETEPGLFQSDIYFVPLFTGGMGAGSAPISEGGNLLTYMEYFSWDTDGGPMAAARAFAPPGVYETAAGGRYLFHKMFPQNLCIKMAAWCQERLKLETPYLAARVTNVSYAPLLHQRQAFTDDAYFVNGGRTNYEGFGPSYEDPTS